MTRNFGYLVMKLLSRHRGDPIGAVLKGSPSTDPSVVAFIEQLRAAGKEESVMVSAPMDSIADAVASGSNPAYGDLQPVVRQPRRRLVRYLATAGFATKMLFGAAALAAVTTTAAVTGTLPNPVQDFVSDSVGNVGIQISRGSESTSPPDTLPIPTSTVPVGAHRVPHRGPGTQQLCAGLPHRLPTGQWQCLGFRCGGGMWR